MNCIQLSSDWKTPVLLSLLILYFGSSRILIIRTIYSSYNVHCVSAKGKHIKDLQEFCGSWKFLLSKVITTQEQIISTQRNPWSIVEWSLTINIVFTIINFPASRGLWRQVKKQEERDLWRSLRSSFLSNRWPHFWRKASINLVSVT